MSEEQIREKYKHHSLCADPIVWDEIQQLLDIISSERALADDLAKVIEDCQNVMKITLSGNSIIFERIDVALQKYRKARKVKP